MAAGKLPAAEGRRPWKNREAERTGIGSASPGEWRLLMPTSVVGKRHLHATQEIPAVSATPRKARRSRNTLRLWTFDQAQAVVPYLGSIVRSLREHALHIQSIRRKLTALEDQPGRPDRRTLITVEEHKRDLARAEEENSQALAELEALDVQLLDAVQGQVLVP